ncbi:hypothetical protein KEM55_004499 [Ascosphaera atra]|nr:hypothetical protein KEM55_004499 [Ascosphaera atra]
MDSIPSAEFSAPTSGARNHRPSISSHTASSTSTMSREGSTGQSTPQEEVVGPNKRAVHPSTTNPMGDPFDQSQKENATGAQPKKKKGQRFFCTDFPPCNLSFTRSEHLARHISRRFSRLDNLRQHAQTVHCNEPIPPDSLANTGSNRFARAARSERARKQTRVGAGRTHARTLSTSSVSSIVTPYGQQQGPEAHARRMAPPPLMLANDGHARARLSLDAAAEPMSPGAAARAAPYWYPAGASPTTSSYGGGTPGYPTTPDSGYFPPATGVQFWDHRRRVSSMPSVGSSYPPPTFTGSRPSYAQVFSSPEEHAYPPPPPPPAPATSYPDEDLRRRTWHPSPRDITNKSNSRPSTSDSDIINSTAPTTTPLRQASFPHTTHSTLRTKRCCLA